jgi:hypothetical protein
MDLVPADIKNPCDYGPTNESDGNRWYAEYRPTDNIDDIPLTSHD